MPMTSTVDDFATLIGITTKTVREYIREGMPVIRDGDKGPGNGALIDAARAIPWVMKNKRNEGLSSIADFLNTQSPEQQNLLRWSVERYHEGVIRMISAALIGWHRDCSREWRQLGLSDKQMHDLVWKLFGAIALTVLSYKVKKFDAEIRELAGGADLDDLASLYFLGDIRTGFVDAMQIPESMVPYMPSDALDRAEEIARK